MWDPTVILCQLLLPCTHKQSQRGRERGREDERRLRAASPRASHTEGSHAREGAAPAPARADEPPAAAGEHLDAPAKEWSAADEPPHREGAAGRPLPGRVRQQGTDGRNHVGGVSIGEETGKKSRGNGVGGQQK